MFTDILIVKLWNDATGIREHLGLACAFEELVNYGSCVGRRVAADVIGYGINVIECRR